MYDSCIGPRLSETRAGHVVRDPAGHVARDPTGRVARNRRQITWLETPASALDHVLRVQRQKLAKRVFTDRQSDGPIDV